MALGCATAWLACTPQPPKPTTAPTAITQAPVQETEPPWVIRPVRVLLVESAPSALLSIVGPYTIAPRWEKGTGPFSAKHLSGRSGKRDLSPFPIATLAQGTSLRDGLASASSFSLTIGPHHFADDEVVITPARDGSLSVNGRRYRGGLVVRRVASGQLSITNVLPIEDYLCGVLGGETYPAWPPAALEAQAIVARSYVMWRMVQRRKEPYDLVATVMDQNYVGTSKEDPRLRAAVDRTAGMVLLYQMRLFRCYYHSTCGGHTEAVQDVFPDPALLPLSPVPCPYCRGSKHYRWHSAIAKAELAEALRKAGLSARQVVSLQVTSRSRSGRALEVAIGTGDAGGTRMPANDFRLAVGPSRLPSTLFEVRDIGNRLEFHGRGFGHGVGMCQWGAKGMAEAHRSAPEILAHYYPGAELHRLYEGWPRMHTNHHE